MGLLERAERALVVGLCSYEVAAVLTGRVPTITAMNARHPEVGATIIGALYWHFRPPH